jgi:hypothetical protein
MLDDDPLTKPVEVSKLGSAALALLVLPCIAATGAVIVAGIVIAHKEGAIGGLREALAIGIGAFFFPVFVRAFYVLAARVFGKKIEPLVPWWLAILPAVFFAGVMAFGFFTGMRGVLNLGGVQGMLILAPVYLYRVQHRAKP